MTISRKLPTRSQTTRLDQLPYLGQDLFQLWLCARRREVGRCGSAHAARGTVYDFIPPPNLDGPKEDDIDVPILRCEVSYPPA